jgi:hypothetical protein
MGDRIALQTLLENVAGFNRVYFQPPPTFKIVYPCIIYERKAARTKFADNNPYSYDEQYKVTIIDPNPDNVTRRKIAALQKCTFETYYTVDQLNHDVFSLFF